MKITLTLLLIVTLNTTALFAQDVHLSQFYTADHLINPAKVGDYDGDYRISANYRNQWRQIQNTPLTTFVVAFDKAFHYYSHQFNAGIMVIRDQFSGFQTQTTKILITAAYGREWRKNKFRIGIQSGMVSNSTNLSLQSFPSQWDYQQGKFDQSVPTLETTIRPSQTYIDANIGVTWARTFKRTKVNAGVALNHFDRPKDTYFSKVAERRRIRKVVHGGIDVPIAPSLRLQPQFQWMWTDNANELLLGSNLEHSTGNPSITKLRAGVFYRHGINRTQDAFYPVIGATYKRFDVGISYDINISELSAHVKRVRSFELSLIYTAPSSKLKYRIIPCARY